MVCNMVTFFTNHANNCQPSKASKLILIGKFSNPLKGYCFCLRNPPTLQHHSAHERFRCPYSLPMLNEFHAAIRSDKQRKLRTNAFNRDLRNIIHAETPRAIAQTKAVARRLAGSSHYHTCANVHRFLRENFIYLRDSGSAQKILLPSAAIRKQTFDCKTYSLLAFALLHNCGVPGLRYKYASYADELGNGSRIPSHIYVVADEGQIIIDGTCPQFNYEKEPFHSFTINPLMKVYTISGDVLANEVLAGEVLANDAALKFAKRLHSMDKRKRKAYLSKFTPANRMKLLRSVKSALVEKKLKMQGGMLNDSPFDWEQDAATDSTLAGKKYANDEVLAGKKAKARRAKRKEEKAAKAKPGSNKAKRLATKAKILKAKATGDKTALKAARKERNQRIKENAKKVGKVFAKINPVLALGRGAFIALVRLNVRGFATNIAMLKDTSELKKKWEAIGGKWSKLQAAVNKGKGKKPLLGKKKLSDEVLAEELTALYGIGDGGASAATLTAASSVIAIIIPTLMKLLKKEGKKPTEDLNGDGLINDLDAPEVKSKFTQIVDKVQDFIESRPVLNDAYEAGKESVAKKFEELGIKTGSPSEAEEEDTASEGTPMWKMLGGAGILGFGLYYLSKSKKAA